MTKYKQSSVKGGSHHRWHEIHINNPFKDTSSISIVEESILQLEDGKVFHDNTRMMMANFEVSKEVTIVNPVTGEPTGEVLTHADYHRYIYSLCLQIAQERDAQEAAQAEQMAAIA